MSHNFKRPAPVTEQESKEAEVRWLARRVGNQAMLDEVLAKCQPALRHVVYEHIRPYLTFENPVEPVIAEVSAESVV